MSMMRTVLALWEGGGGPAQGIDARRTKTAALSIDGVQTTLDSGGDVISGEAAYVGAEDQTVPVIEETDDGAVEIDEESRSMASFHNCEWFAVPKGAPGFAAFDASDVDYARNLLGFETNDIPEYAHYDLRSVVDVLEDHDARFTQVGWSEDDDEGEAGMWYPSPVDNDSEGEQITNRGLRRNLSQVGFSVQTDHGYLRGTIAESGYLALYDPEDLDVTDWVGILRDLFLPHAYIPEDEAGVQQTLGGGGA